MAQARSLKKDTDRKKKHFFVAADEIRKNKYDLSINRYKEVVYEEEEYDPPSGDIGRMMELEKRLWRIWKSCGGCWDELNGQLFPFGKL